MPRLDLRKLILLLAIVSALLTFANSFLASYKTQRQQLMAQTLEANRAYAAKLAHITQSFFGSMQDQLAYSASVLAERFDKHTLRAEVERLAGQSDSYNTVLVVAADGTVLVSSKDTRYLENTLLNSAGARQALTLRQPLISPPYMGANEELVVFISHPIYANNRYLGYVGGAIYLQKPNVLHSLLGRHYYRDGSYLYVVDGQGQLIYHPLRDRVGEQVPQNPVVKATMEDREGAERVVNSLGVDMLAGYAHVPAADWGVVAQRPTEETLRELEGLAWMTMRNAVPFSVVSLFVFWWLAKLIARPLRDLANTARTMDAADAPGRIEQVPGWYYEAHRLKQAMLSGVLLLHQKVGRLSQENVTDPLTGLTNRRGMQLTLDTWRAQGTPFAVAALDIDHFKRINDTFGHDTGDEVLKFLAQQMRKSARGSDLLCRSGGEEFLMLLPGTGYSEALLVAERLCTRVAATDCPTGEPITISIGIAHSNGQEEISGVLKQADMALYAAKRSGRNRVHGAQVQPA